MVVPGKNPASEYVRPQGAVRHGVNIPVVERLAVMIIRIQRKTLKIKGTNRTVQRILRRNFFAK